MPTPDEILVTVLDARVRYWHQWGIEIAYATEDRAKIMRVIKRHRKNPFALATKAEALILKIEAPLRKQIGGNNA